MINKAIDYLQFSVSEAPDFLGKPILTEGSPLAFYKASQLYSCGARSHGGNHKSDKWLVQMPGKSCERWDMTNYPARLEHILTTGGTFSRIDLAVTVDGQQALLDFREALRTEKIISKRFMGSAAKVISDAYGNTETVYLGELKKRAKKGVFRAYDKGVEQKLTIHASRFELETRKKQAQVMVKRYVKGVEIGNLIRQVVDIPSAEWWIEMMGEKSQALPRDLRQPPENKVASKWHWLNTQVAPALGRLMQLDEKEYTNNYGVFVAEVEKHLRRARWLDTQG